MARLQTFHAKFTSRVRWIPWAGGAANVAFVLAPLNVPNRVIDTSQRLTGIGIEYAPAGRIGRSATTQLDINVLGFAAFTNIDNCGLRNVGSVRIINSRVVTRHPYTCLAVNAGADFLMSGGQVIDAVDALVVGFIHCVV